MYAGDDATTSPALVALGWVAVVQELHRHLFNGSQHGYRWRVIQFVLWPVQIAHAVRQVR